MATKVTTFCDLCGTSPTLPRREELLLPGFTDKSPLAAGIVFEWKKLRSDYSFGVDLADLCSFCHRRVLKDLVTELQAKLTSENP